MDEFTVTTPGLVYLKANKSFSGGHGGMWYRLKYTDGALSACVWPFPWCFEKTDDTQKAFAEFPFDADGLARAGGLGGRTVRGRCAPLERMPRNASAHTGRNRRGGYRRPAPVPGAEDAPFDL